VNLVSFCGKVSPETVETKLSRNVRTTASRNFDVLRAFFFAQKRLCSEKEG